MNFVKFAIKNEERTIQLCLLGVVPAKLSPPAK